MSYLLVVDDDPDIRVALRDVLEDEGYTVAEARDGQMALEMLRQPHDPLVVLLDFMMPRLDGLGVLKAIEANPQLHDHNAFIMLTAAQRPLPSDLTHYLKALDVPVLRKPFDTEQLLACVRQATSHIDALPHP